MAKAKVETRGRKTALERIERARREGTGMPVDPLPIPHAIKEKLRGRDAMDILKEAAPYCATYIINCVIGKKFKPSWARIDVAKYVIDQVHGRAKIKAEFTGAGGAPLDWKGVIILAGIYEEMLNTGQIPAVDGGNGSKKPLFDVSEVSTRALMIPPTPPKDADQPPEDNPQKAPN